LKQHFGAASWIVVIGLGFGLFAGVQTWIRAGDALFGGDARYAYEHLPGTQRPWLLAFAYPFPPKLVVALHLASIGLISMAGLLVALLVRPKNRGADVAAGALTGFIFGTTAAILSLGWLISVPVAVWPIRDDLALVSEAALAQPNPQVRQRAEARLLEKYPDLRGVAAGERGRVFAAKVRTDLIAGLPLAVWFIALIILLAIMPMFTMQVMAAGPLLRRHGASARLLPLYLERAIPATLLIGMTGALLGTLATSNMLLRHGIDVRSHTVWYVPVLATLLLSLTGTLRGWAWPARLMLHAAWLCSMGLLVYQWLSFRPG
jgi:hypothetical protein